MSILPQSSGSGGSPSIRQPMDAVDFRARFA